MSDDSNIARLISGALKEQALYGEPGVKQSDFAALVALPGDWLLAFGERMLQSGDPAARILGTRVLREMPKEESRKRDLDARIGGKITALLDTESDPEVVTWAVSALIYVETPGGAETLRRFVAYPDPFVRYAVASAAAAYLSPPPGAIDVLVKLAADEQREVRWSAVFEIAVWADDSPDVRGALESATLSDDPEIREMGVGGLGRLDGKTITECPELATISFDTPKKNL